jgi:hypothetical protein
VPGFVKTKEKLPPPELIVLESQEIAAPLSLVDVCGAPELLTHTTVDPTLTVTLEGSNAKEPAAPVILIVVAFAGIVEVVEVGAGAVVAVGALVESLDVAAAVVPQPASATSAPTESSNAPRDASRRIPAFIHVMVSLLLFD